MSEWIEWKGGSSGPPEIEGLRCDIKLRSGEIEINENSYDWWGYWNWASPSQGTEDIVAYRLSKANGDKDE